MSALIAQSPSSNNKSRIVSLYQLDHKPTARARRLFSKGAAQLRVGAYTSALDLRQEDAEKAFQRAIEIDPGNPVGYTNLGVVAFNLNDLKLSEEVARRALQIMPTLAQAKVLLGIVQIAGGRWTSQTRKLLEETRGTIPEIEQILRSWPAEGGRGLG